MHRFPSIVRPLVCALAVLAASLAPVGPLRAAENEVLEKRFAEANAKVDAGEFQAALDLYNEILEAEPKAGNVWIMRGVAKWNLKDRSGARADLAQAIALHPDNFDAYRVRGQFRYQQEDFSGSLADFNKAIELTRQKPVAEFFGMRAELHRRLGDHPSAIYDLDRAIDLKPTYVAALFLRAQLYEAGGEIAAAEQDYSKAIALDPRHADALANRAWIRFHASRWDESIADGRATLALAPQAAAALRVVGYAEFAQGDYAGAAKTLTAAADAEPGADGAFALFIRHHALLRSGGGDKRLATSWGKWTDSPWLQTLAKFITGQIDEEAVEAAAKETKDTEEAAGRACEMHFYIGLARKQAGDKPTARLRFQAAIAANQKTFVEHTLAQAELARP